MSRSRSAVVWMAAGCLAWAVGWRALAAEPAGEASTPVKQTLARLGWMARTWGGTQDDVSSEEHWMEPRGGLMLGIHRDIANGKAVFFEFLRIEESPEGLAYQAQPLGRSAVRFPCKELGDRRVVFENLQHDYPQRILYWLEADGSLAARVEGSQDGKPRFEEWRWRPLP